MLLLLSACYLPTAYGIRDDGLLPTGPEVSAQGIQPGAVTAAGANIAHGTWLGAQGRFRVGEGVGVRAEISTMPVVGEDESGLLAWNGEGDVLIGVTQEPRSAVTSTLSLGASALMIQLDQSRPAVIPGLDAGLTVSRTVASTFHPFAGVRLNPVLAPDDTAMWAQLGGGLRWRPPIGRSTGVFGVEAARAHGFGACPGTDPLQCDLWTVGLQAGLTLPSVKEWRPALALR